MRFTPHAISFITHDIVLLRYLELDAQLKTLITVIKTRARPHSPVCAPTISRLRD